MGQPGDLSSGNYVRRLSPLIALQGIFGIILLFTRYLPDTSLVLAVRDGEVLTLLDVSSLSVFALFLILTVTILRYRTGEAAAENDPFLSLGDGSGIPSSTAVLFRLAHALFSVIVILVYLTKSPAFPSLHLEAGALVLAIVLVFSSSRVSSFLTARFGRAGRPFRDNRRRQEVLAYLAYLLAAGLILAGVFSDSRNFIIAGVVALSLQILYVIVHEDRHLRG